MGSLSTDTLWFCSIWPPTYPAHPQGAGIQGERDEQNTLNAFPERAPSTDLTQFVSKPRDKKNVKF